jgi:hypothetical protein
MGCGEPGRLLRGHGGAFLFLLPIHRNKIIIHETGVKSIEYFYLMVIRTAWMAIMPRIVRLGRRSRSVRIWLTLNPHP